MNLAQMQAMQMMSMPMQGLAGMTPEAQAAHLQAFLAHQQQQSPLGLFPPQPPAAPGRNGDGSAN